jgi:hypothetical protein
MTTPTAPERVTNERVELARYTVSAGERVIYGQRVLGVVRLVDHPANGHGRRYVVERELTVMAELEAILADYLRQASSWDTIPATCAPNSRNRPDDHAPRRHARRADPPPDGGTPWRACGWRGIGPPAGRARLQQEDHVSTTVQDSGRRVALEQIRVPENVRTLDQSHVQALAGSISLQGIIVPVVVRGDGDGFELYLQ